MPRIYLCFLWHMHQPFYKDLVSGEYKLPWTRLHALKDYYGMVRILEDFPAIRQTFNVVPSMLLQVEDYAAGTAKDVYFDLALKRAEDLTAAEQDLLLRDSFHADPARMIYRFPRYGELFDARQKYRRDPNARRFFRPQDYRDLQMLSQLAWFDEDWRQQDPEVKAWMKKGGNFTVDEQQRMGHKQQEFIAKVIPMYQKLAKTGQIEISTTPFYHPILPLLCDSNVAAVSHPGVPLPRRFKYPHDARRQLEMSREAIADRFGKQPAGLWPSEGSVSDEVFHIAADLGFEWAASDSGVLGRTLGRTAGVQAIYRPYVWSQSGKQLSVVFRDHHLSDLIGFVYAKMPAAQAAADFLNRIRENSRPILATGRDALVPIILDGENAWEYYEANGRPFFRELYRRISDDRLLQTTTMGEAVRLIEPEPLKHIFPGSWISANFDVWIGAQEDNLAWEHLLRARETYDKTAEKVPEEDRRLAFEELLIAEGSDWNWWYGPEHHSDHRPDFDALYRAHLANAYRALKQNAPEELSRPILKMAAARETHHRPTGLISPTVDGEISSYFEWMGAGLYRVDERGGSMHGKKVLLHEVHYGTNGQSLFLRVDFVAGKEADLRGAQLHFKAKAEGGTSQVEAVLDLDRQRDPGGSDDSRVRFARGRVLEIELPLSALEIAAGAWVSFQLSLWQNQLPLDATPQQGWIDLATADPAWFE